MPNSISTQSILDPLAHIGVVTIGVSDIRRSVAFYTDVLGFDVAENDAGRVLLGAVGGAAFLELIELPDAIAKPRGSTGLFHFAILVPSRYDLSRSLRRLVATQWPLSGASDHAVSEALYLNDPDGNGIEIYRDRPRSEWPVRNGLYAMVTDPLDMEGVYEEASDTGDDLGVLASGTRIGHVHVQVANLDEARQFYVDGLGLDIVAKYPSALFAAAGGYHHHVGINTWGSAGGSLPPPNAVGLMRFEVLVSNASELVITATRLGGIVVADSFEVAEPSGGLLLVRVGQ